MWNTKTLEAMEETAKGEADGTANRRFRPHSDAWLEVKWDGKEFTYRWGKNLMSRKEAQDIFNLYAK